MIPILLGLTLTGGKAVAVLCVVAALGAAALMSLDNKREGLKREAAELAILAEKEGFPMVSGILQDAAVGDLSGLATHIRNFAQTLRNPDTRKQAVNGMLEVQLNKHLDDESLRAVLFSQIRKRLGDEVIKKELEKHLGYSLGPPEEKAAA